MTTNLAKIFTQIPIIAIAPAKIPTLTITGIALDSRQVQPGYLFVALTGGSADGHRYIPAAVAQGAAAVVGQQPAHVGMAGKQHAVEIVGLALELVGARKDLDDRGHRRRLIGLDLDADAHVLGGGQKMVDHVEALLARRPVDRGDVDDRGEPAARLVAQECRNPHDLIGMGRDGELA